MDTLGAAGGTSSVPAISFYPHGDPDEVADVEEASAADGGDGFLRMISSSEQSDGRWRRAAGGTGGLGDSRRSSRCTLRSTLDANHVSAAAAAAAGASRPLSDASSPPGWTVLFGDRGGGGSHAPSETELHRLSLTEFGADRDADLLEDPAAAAGEDVAAAIAAKLSADSPPSCRRIRRRSGAGARTSWRCRSASCSSTRRSGRSRRCSRASTRRAGSVSSP